MPTPFWHDAKSTKVLHDWLWKADLDLSLNNVFMFANVANYVTENNRPLKVAEIKAALPELRETIDQNEVDKIVALGKTAEKALTLLGLDFYAMPHPSGLNRKLNDKNYVEEKINGLKEYLTAHQMPLI